MSLMAALMARAEPGVSHPRTPVEYLEQSERGATGWAAAVVLSRLAGLSACRVFDLKGGAA